LVNACNHFADDAEADVADPMHMYYVNDGVYGSFNCILYDHVTVEASLLDVSRHCCQSPLTCAYYVDFPYEAALRVTLVLSSICRVSVVNSKAEQYTTFRFSVEVTCVVRRRHNICAPCSAIASVVLKYIFRSSQLKKSISIK